MTEIPGIGGRITSMPHRGKLLSIIGGTLALVVLLLLWRALAARSGIRPSHLGVAEGRLAPCPVTPNCVSSQSQGAPHRMEPIPLLTSREEARERLTGILEAASGARLVTVRPDYLHAEFQVPLTPFVDDVEFYLDEGAGLIHYRSASRLGRSDMGVNRRRMAALMEAFQNQERGEK